ncbi:MAG: MBL fold metallo-hydrolase [Gemmatimonadota bacterium]
MNEEKCGRARWNGDALRIGVLGLGVALLGCRAPADRTSGAAGSAAHERVGGGGTEGTAPSRRVDYSRGTHLVLLGTGTPNSDPDRWGPAVAVVVDGRAYLVDAGVGVVRRAAAAARLGFEGLQDSRLDIAFITHLHSDHTLGLPDLILSPWVEGRDHPLRLYGPPGVSAMAQRILEAYGEDIGVRVQGPQPANSEGFKVDAHVIKPGVVYQDERVKVTAFLVPHDVWDYAFGYRFDTAEQSIVLSGDTAPSDSVVAACDGCDILVHEVYSDEGFARRSPAWQRYHLGAHTSATKLGELAARAHPGLLVLYHQLLWGSAPDEVLREIRQGGYEGPLAYGHDLDIF